MGKILVSIGVFVYFAVYLTDAQSLRDRINKVNSIDDSPEDFRYSRHRPIKHKSTGQDYELDDFEATDGGFQSPEEKDTADDMEEEFQSDLKAIRRFAQGIRPIAKSMRRSMNTRRGMGQEVSIMIKFAKDTIINIIDAADKYIPHLKPLTKYLRKFVVRIFGH